MLFTRYRAALIVAAILFVFPVVAHNASGQEFRQSVESLKDVSDSVVIAKTLRSESFWNEDRSAILTRVFLQVEESLTGSSPTRTEVIIPGGQIGEFIHEVSDMPFFVDNEESIVFIERHESGVNVVAGGAFGKISIERDPVTQIRSISASPFFLTGENVEATGEAGSNEPGVSPPGGTAKKKSMTLDEFKQRIK